MVDTLEDTCSSRRRACSTELRPRASSSVSRAQRGGRSRLVLNRPVAVAVAELVPQLEDLVDDGEQCGSAPRTAECRARARRVRRSDDAAVPPSARSASRRSTSQTTSSRDDAPPRLRRLRGLGRRPARGRGETRRRILEPALNDDAFTESPDELWADVLRRKGGIYELVSRMPRTRRSTDPARTRSKTSGHVRQPDRLLDIAQERAHLASTSSRTAATTWPRS